jgi:hypothetical protein
MTNALIYLNYAQRPDLLLAATGLCWVLYGAWDAVWDVAVLTGRLWDWWQWRRMNALHAELGIIYRIGSPPSHRIQGKPVSLELPDPKFKATRQVA